MLHTSRSARARLSVLGLTLLLAATSLSSSQARAEEPVPVVGNPGEFHSTLVDGELLLPKDSFLFRPQCQNSADDDLDDKIDYPTDNGCADENDDNEKVRAVREYHPPELRGTVDEYGQIHVPKENMTFPPRLVCLWEPILFDECAAIAWAEVIIVATEDATGTINPVTGAVTLNTKLHVSFENWLLPNVCEISEDIDLHLTTGRSGEQVGVPYDTATGTATLVENQFEVQVANCDKYSGDINDRFELPVDPGEAAASFISVIDPIVLPPPDMSISVNSDSRFRTATPGHYELTATNEGPVATSGTIAVQQTIPRGLTAVDAAGSGWQCPTLVGTVTCTTEARADPGETLPTVTVTVVPSHDVCRGNVTTRAEVAYLGDPIDTNNTASRSTPVDCLDNDLAVSMRTDRSRVDPGDILTYSIEVANVGNNRTVGDVVVVDNLPQGLAFESAEGADWRCWANEPQVVCEALGALEPADRSQIDLRVTVTLGSGSVKNTVELGYEPDENPDNDTASITTSVGKLRPQWVPRQY